MTDITWKPDAYDSVELHLNAHPLARGFANRIKACGGRYSECRGYSMTRFVHVPASETALMNDLVRCYATGRKTTAIARFAQNNGKGISWVVVQKVDAEAHEPPADQFRRKYEAAAQQARARGYI